MLDIPEPQGLSDGKSVECETVWDAFRREAGGYAPDQVAAITGVPAEDLAKEMKKKPRMVLWVPK